MTPMCRKGLAAGVLLVGAEPRAAEKMAELHTSQYRKAVS
jgi:hypothetical protein